MSASLRSFTDTEATEDKGPSRSSPSKIERSDDRGTPTSPRGVTSESTLDTHTVSSSDLSAGVALGIDISEQPTTAEQGASALSGVLSESEAQAKAFTGPVRSNTSDPGANTDASPNVRNDVNAINRVDVSEYVPSKVSLSIPANVPAVVYTNVPPHIPNDVSAHTPAAVHPLIPAIIPPHASADVGGNIPDGLYSGVGSDVLAANSGHHLPNAYPHSGNIPAGIPLDGGSNPISPVNIGIGMSSSHAPLPVSANRARDVRFAFPDNNHGDIYTGSPSTTRTPHQGSSEFTAIRRHPPPPASNPGTGYSGQPFRRHADAHPSDVPGDLGSQHGHPPQRDVHAEYPG